MEEYIIKFLFIAKAIKNKNRSVISSYKLSPNEIDLLVALDMGVYDTAKEIADGNSAVHGEIVKAIKEQFPDN